VKRRVRFSVFILAGLLVAGALVLLVSSHASSQPDGLARVANDHGLATQQQQQPRPHPFDYGPLAGVVGVVVAFALTGGLFLIVRQPR
jgi:hypothetical protein